MVVTNFLEILPTTWRQKLTGTDVEQNYPMYSGVSRMNEVKSMSGPVSTWMGDRLRAGIPSRYVTSQLGQLSLASLQGCLIEYQLRLG